jgi:creatinine amidohydrolase
MRKTTTTLVLLIAVAACVTMAARHQAPKGIRLDGITWPQAEKALTADTVVVIPLGAAATEHGRHLTLGNDMWVAEYLAARAARAADVVLAPTVPYHYYPAFLEYPGSTSLTLETARTLTTEIVRSLSRHGPRRFYVLNTGVSTLRPLQASAQELAAEGILLAYTDVAASVDAAARPLRQQEGGTHADEIDTSMMLYIEPGSVDMTLAAKDYVPGVDPRAGLTRRPGGRGAYSPSGVWGDATLATPEKGRIITEALLAAVLADIERVRQAALPHPRAQAATSAPAPTPAVPGRRASGERSCTPQDERAIRQVGDAFTLHWSNQDAVRLSALWTLDGDIIHPDEMIETGRKTIMANRTALFMRREYRGSRHLVVIRMIRCLTPGIAVADGKWELRGVNDANGQQLPNFEGQVTLVLQRSDGWFIEAYRYTNKPSAPPPPQMWFKRPGLPDKTP